MCYMTNLVQKVLNDNEIWQHMLHDNYISAWHNIARMNKLTIIVQAPRMSASPKPSNSLFELL
jgi:hypothetical protein